MRAVVFSSATDARPANEGVGCWIGMALDYPTAFGWYLRTLRERRRLSLDEVCALSESFSERIEKGNLSRYENGRQQLGLPKIIPISRIYRIPSDALLERMELDRQLDRIGGPDTSGLDFAELRRTGYLALKRDGLRWEAYARLRDALMRAASDPLMPQFDSPQHQVADSILSFASAAKSLGRHQLALHECLYLDSTAEQGAPWHDTVLERIGNCYTHLGEVTLAQKFLTAAIDSARAHGNTSALAYAYFSYGFLQVRFDRNQAAESFLAAHRAFREAPPRPQVAMEGQVFEARTLLNLGVCYLETERFAAAREALNSCREIGLRWNLRRDIALAEVNLGDLDDHQGRPQRAAERWREALRISRELDDRALRFSAEYHLLKQALRRGEMATSRAIARRLRRLRPWLTGYVDAVDRFEKLIAEHPEVLED
jgi:tetratricopeptide (TPR) repeat protein